MNLSLLPDVDFESVSFDPSFIPENASGIIGEQVLITPEAKTVVSCGEVRMIRCGASHFPTVEFRIFPRGYFFRISADVSTIFLMRHLLFLIGIMYPIVAALRRSEEVLMPQVMWQNENVGKSEAPGLRSA